MDEVMEVVEATPNSTVSTVLKEKNISLECDETINDDCESLENASDKLKNQENGTLDDSLEQDVELCKTKNNDVEVVDKTSNCESSHSVETNENGVETSVNSAEKTNSVESSEEIMSVKLTDSEQKESPVNCSVTDSEKDIESKPLEKNEVVLNDSKSVKLSEGEVSSSVDAEKEENNSKKEEKNILDKDSNENGDVTDIVKKKDDSGKKKKGKVCVVCSKKRKIAFRIHFQGKVQLICSDQCYKQFKEKQTGESKTEAAPKSDETSHCSQCQKLVLSTQGYFPVVGEMKPLCSEDCVKKYQENNGPPRKCSQCETKVEDKSCHLTWETMVFCGEDCLGKYQSFLGSHCTCCQGPVQQASLGKYCVCFGSDIRQFCSGSCLDDFKKGLKVCTFCQTDLSAGTEGFLAPVGDKGQFKDFCSQSCMERYETVNNLSKTAPEIQECAHCKKQGTFKIQVSHQGKKYFLCCDSCVSGLRCTLNNENNVCASCHKFFVCPSLYSSNKENNFKFKMDGQYKFFCSKTCMTTYVLSHRRITQCLFCKVKKYNFDMIEKVEENEGPKIFCSLNCLSLHRANAGAASSKSIRCDNCQKQQSAQYHLTMSDGSIRNFCAYNCVLAFQNQFTSVPALTTTSMTRQMTTPVQTLKTTPAISAPVIANVVSLAQSRAGTPTVTKPLVPQTLVSVRPTRQPVAVFTTKPQVSTVSSSTVPVVTTSSQIMREVIIQPPAPKSVKNKTVWCKPIMQTKGINAKISACHKSVQTDDNPRPIILPVPIPIYVPTPLHMFSRPVPCAVPFPVPIPVPILIPSSKAQLKNKQESISLNEEEFNEIEKESSDGLNTNKENPKRSLSPQSSPREHKRAKCDPENSTLNLEDEETRLKIP